MKQTLSLVKEKGFLFAALFFSFSLVFSGQAFAAKGGSEMGLAHRSEQATISLEKAKDKENRGKSEEAPAGNSTDHLRGHERALSNPGAEHRSENATIGEEAEEIVEESAPEVPVV